MVKWDGFVIIALLQAAQFVKAIKVRSWNVALLTPHQEIVSCSPAPGGVLDLSKSIEGNQNTQVLLKTKKENNTPAQTSDISIQPCVTCITGADVLRTKLPHGPSRSSNDFSGVILNQKYN